MKKKTTSLPITNATCDLCGSPMFTDGARSAWCGGKPAHGYRATVTDGVVTRIWRCGVKTQAQCQIKVRIPAEYKAALVREASKYPAGAMSVSELVRDAIKDHLVQLGYCVV